MVTCADLDPREVACIEPSRVTAVACAGGAPLSHAAILARSLGIPVVTGLGPALLDLSPGTVVLVDGDAGTVVVAPSPAAVAAAERRRGDDRRRLAESRRRAPVPAVTADGQAIEVLANAASAGDAAAAVVEGADGVGMLRTELAFLTGDRPPGEHEQYRVYRAVADALGGRRLVVRTLDLGADIPAWGGAPEPNPALGNRGLRLALNARHLLDPQLRAVARLARERPVQLMFPMVTTVDELRSARACVDEVAGPGHGIEVGITVEVPAAALTAGVLAPLVDFLAVGTNDLTQYTLAVDRANAAVAPLADGLHPAVLSLVGAVTAAGACHGRPVEVVGELAGDPLAIPVLLGLGVTTLSVRPNTVAVVKQVVRATRLETARSLAEAALAAESAPAVRALVAAAGT